MASNGTFHWSKDFVEHLRVVHFSITLTAIVLMIAAFDRENAEAAAALTQISEISSFQNEWKDFPRNIFLQAYRESNLQDSWRPVLSVSFPAGFYPDNRIEVPFTISQEDLFNSPIWKLQGLDLPDELSTLNDFKQFWNKAHSKFSVPLLGDVPSGPACGPSLELKWSDGSEGPYVETRPGLEITHNPKKNTETFGPPTDPLDCNVSTKLGYLSYGDVPLDKKAFIYQGGDPFEKVNFKLVGREPDFFRERPLGNSEGYGFSLTFDLPRKKLTYARGGHRVQSASSRSNIPVEVKEQSADETTIARASWKGSEKGDFDNAFPQLKEKAKNEGLYHLTISEVMDHIRTEHSSAPQNLSLLGVEVRMADVSFWGTAVLVGIQLYLWLHLHELTARIAPDSEGWDVAWIGIYHTRLSAVLTILSACALPDCSAILLTYRAVHEGVGGLLTAAYISVVTVGVLVSILTALKLLQLRGRFSASGATRS